MTYINQLRTVNINEATVFGEQHWRISASVISLPAEIIDGMRGSPMWGWFTGLAHTLPYDVALCGPGMRLPADRFAAITVPALAIGGGASLPWLPAAASAVAEAIPGGRYVSLDGQDHGVLQHPGALRDLLTGYFNPGTDQSAQPR